MTDPTPEQLRELCDRLRRKHSTFLERGADGSERCMVCWSRPDHCNTRSLLDVVLPILRAEADRREKEGK